MAGFMGKFKGDATAVRKKKFAEGTLRYNLYKQAKETLKSGINLKQVKKGLSTLSLILPSNPSRATIYLKVFFSQ